ncbi:MAG: SDR family NAD(P)-dependent oxidoreductase [Cyclobacteriaceae bacterium]
MMKKRTWLVTGASSGLGKALVEQLLLKEQHVIATFRAQEQVDAFNEGVVEQGMAFRIDLSDPISITNGVQEVFTQIGQIDVLVNNAGYGMAGAIEETSMEEFRGIMETNFFGTLALTRALLPKFRKQGNGHIVQISSHGGVKAFPGFGAYNASKFALEGFSEALQGEVTPMGIHLTIVEPGPFRTEFAGTGFKLAGEQIAAYSDTAGIFREKIKSVDGKQEGDPSKGAQAIIEMVNQPNPPLRLPLGKIALDTITTKADSLLQDVQQGRQTAEQAVFA